MIDMIQNFSIIFLVIAFYYQHKTNKHQDAINDSQSKINEIYKDEITTLFNAWNKVK